VETNRAPRRVGAVEVDGFLEEIPALQGWRGKIDRRARRGLGGRGRGSPDEWLAPVFSYANYISRSVELESCSSTILV